MPSCWCLCSQPDFLEQDWRNSLVLQWIWISSYNILSAFRLQNQEWPLACGRKLLKFFTLKIPEFKVTTDSQENLIQEKGSSIEIMWQWFSWKISQQKVGRWRYHKNSQETTFSSPRYLAISEENNLTRNSHFSGNRFYKGFAENFFTKFVFIHFAVFWFTDFPTCLQLWHVTLTVFDFSLVQYTAPGFEPMTS